MDYSKMTKAELVLKIKEQKHLSEAVQAKDKEIVQLQTKVKKLEKDISNMVPKESHTALNNTLRDMVPKSSLEEAKEKLKSFEGSIKKDELQRLVGRYEEERNRALSIASHYMNSYNDLLKVLKVNLDMAITTSDLLSEKFKTFKGE